MYMSACDLNLDLSHSAAMFSLRRIKSFVFAWPASKLLGFGGGGGGEGAMFLHGWPRPDANSVRG